MEKKLVLQKTQNFEKQLRTKVIKRLTDCLASLQECNNATDEFSAFLISLKAKQCFRSRGGFHE